MKNYDDESIKAAGGLVWREDSDGKKIAIIHRTRYGNEWTLPKGKLKKGETFQEAAKREVIEEIGCSNLKIEDFAGEISYFVGNKPKIVLFWNILLQGVCEFKKSEEVDQIQWLSIPQAIKLLTYPKEKNLLKEITIKPTSVSKQKKI